MDIRLEQMPFEVNGKTYQLRCNMNVLAEVQEQFEGDFVNALDGKTTMKSALAFLAAMLNDYADEKGWEERFTPKSLGRMFKLNDLPVFDIMGLVVRSITPDTAPDADAGN